MLDPRKPLAIACLVVLVAAAPSLAQSTIRFAEVSAAAQVSVRHDHLGVIVDGNELQNLFGSGVAFEDIDGDAWPDLVLASGATGRSVFLNQADGTFLDQSQWFAALNSRTSTGVVMADANNDGRLDLLMTNYYGEPWFFRGGATQLIEQTAAHGLDPLMFAAGQEPPLWVGPPSMGAAFGDWNCDGFVDLYVANYLPFRRDMFLRAAGGSYFQRTTVVGAFDEHAGFQPVFVDLDDDGDMDIFVVNDFAKDFYFENQGAANGYELQEKAGRYGLAGNSSWPSKFAMGMGVTFGDFDNDLDFDIYIGDYEENPLFVNPGGPGPNGLFEERGAQRGVTAPLNSWGTMFLDAENDGDLDLCVVGGWIWSEPFLDQGRAIDDHFFENLGAPEYRFADATTSANFHDLQSGRGLALADYDRDGKLDVAVWNCSVEDPPDLRQDNIYYPGDFRLHRNESTAANHWVGLKLVGSGPPNTNVSGIGARVFVTAGGITRMNEVRAGESYLSHNSLEIEMGLGTATSIEEVRVRWPTGVVEQFQGVQLDAYQALREGSGVIEQYGNLVPVVTGSWDRYKVTLQWTSAPWFVVDSVLLERAFIDEDMPAYVEIATAADEVHLGGGSISDLDADWATRYVYRLTLRSHGGAFVQSVVLPVETDLLRLEEVAPPQPAPGSHRRVLEIPQHVRLQQNFPNPFNPSTRIAFSLPAAGPARVELLDLRGRSVRVLYDSVAPKGETRLYFDGTDGNGNRLASGSYIYALTTREGSVARRLTLLR